MPARTARALVALLMTAAVVPSLAVAPAQADGFESKAQRRLNQLGCDAGPADGRIGDWTRTAIVRFQAANRLHQSGTLSQRTRTRMYADRQVRCDRRPVVRSGQGRRVVVSQTQNYVWLVQANGRVLAQGGLVDNPGELRPGSYRVGSLCGRQAKIRMNSDHGGQLWLPYFTRFANCGVGFHRIPVDKSSGNQIHPDWLLGTNYRLSSGCIRLSQRVASRMWTFAGVGTRVVVVR